jgi:hypothetical protein
MAHEAFGRSAKRRDATGSRAEFVVLYGLIFTLFLVATIISRLMPWRWRDTFTGRAPSLFAEVRTHTASVVPFLFMG